MNIAVVGGGWAGLSSAITAAKLGHRVDLFESAATLGGRARSVHSPALNTHIDNGQHILLGAYTATLGLMRDLGLDATNAFLRLPLNLRSANGSLTMQAIPGLPAPLNIAAGLMLSKGLHLNEKLAAIRAMTTLRRKGWRVPRSCTVQEWLALNMQPRRLQELIWWPLCIATLNTPPDQACAQLFANVLRDSLGSKQSHATDMLIPNTTLTDLWPAEVKRIRGIKVFHSTTVQRICYDNATALDEEGKSQPSICLDDRPERYQAVFVCTNTPSASRLLHTLPPAVGSSQYLARLDGFEHAPIATFTVQLESPWKLPAPMLLLHEDRSRGHFGQWLFEGQFNKTLVHVVVSDAGSLQTWPREDVRRALLQQLQEQVAGMQCPVSSPTPLS